MNFSGLTNVIIPDSVTSIGNSAFSGCTGLTNMTILNSVTSIGNHAFSGCTGLTSVIILNSVTSIKDTTFFGCTGLTNVIIPNSVTSIGNHAFSGCTGLTNVTIPDSVISIGYGAFYECTSLTEVFTNNLCRYEDVFRIKVMKKNGSLIKYNSECEIHECVICYNNFEENEDILILECFHTHGFHRSCIDKIEDKCPICRHPIECSTSDLGIKFIPIIL